MAAHDPHAIPGTPGGSEHAHPSSREYIVIAVVLTVLTGLEVAVYYIPFLHNVLVPLIAILGIFKFVFVVGWYMHLKFDAKIFTWLFVFGLAVACAAISGLWALFNGWGG